LADPLSRWSQGVKFALDSRFFEENLWHAPSHKSEFLSIKPAAILHHIPKDDLADYLIENDPAFKSRIEEAYAEYATSGRIIGHELIKRLERKREKEKA